MSDKDREYTSIPTSKVQRAMKVIGTGMKVGGNYLAHYSKGLVSDNTPKEKLHEKNAETVFKALGEMKGTALKMAQMMSMDEFTLPESYQKIFQQAQHNAPPLSFPLVQKTFRTQFGKDIDAYFDQFSRTAIHAASIGQVHKASIGEKSFAVKVQYPGVAESIESDIRLMRPIAQKVLNVNAKDLDFYLTEVKLTLLEETDYVHELKMAEQLGEACESIPNLIVPKYYSNLSSSKVITMDWVEGTLLSEWLELDPTPELRQKVAQTIWDTFLFQMQELRLVHADPHPGNFIIQENGTVCLIDFGCVKAVPEPFYQDFFRLLLPGILDNNELFMDALDRLNFFSEDDSPQDKAYLFETLQFSITMLAKPFQTDQFNFGEWDYMKGIYDQGEQMAKEIRKRKINGARGPKEAIYLLRTFYGLYMILAKISAPVQLNYPLIHKLKKD